MTFLRNYVAAIQLKTSYWLFPFILKETYQKTDEVTRLLEGFRNHLMLVECELFIFLESILLGYLIQI